MNNLLIKSKKTLAIVTGILFSSVLINTMSEKIPINYVEANQSNGIGTSSISTSVEVEENLIIKELVIIPVPSYVPDAQKIENIRVYLSARKAPLADYAETFVRAADEYGIDYRIVAAISVIESGGGKHTFRPYNAWGWGKKTFTSWEEGIWAVSKGISNYYSRGLTTPKLISTYYCPPSATSWANKVQFVMNEIGN